MPEKILVVEDEPTLLETLEYNLIRQGYVVLTASDGRVAVQTALREAPDIIILDLMLPSLDGYEVCRLLRREMNTPILMLTARTDEVDKIVGLEMGADDYLTKPFSMRGLLARVRALLRRVRLVREEMADRAEREPQIIESGDLVIDLVCRRPIAMGSRWRSSPGSTICSSFWWSIGVWPSHATRYWRASGGGITLLGRVPWMCTSAGCAKGWNGTLPTRRVWSPCAVPATASRGEACLKASAGASQFPMCCLSSWCWEG